MGGYQTEQEIEMVCRSEWKGLTKGMKTGEKRASWPKRAGARRFDDNAIWGGESKGVKGILKENDGANGIALCD